MARTHTHICICVCYETNVNMKCNDEDTIPSDVGKRNSIYRMITGRRVISFVFFVLSFSFLSFIITKKKMKIKTEEIPSC